MIIVNMVILIVNPAIIYFRISDDKLTPVQERNIIQNVTHNKQEDA